MANTTAEILWVESLLTKLKIPYKTPHVYCDNISAVALTQNLILHARIKHMELDIFFVREKVLSKNLTITHVPSFAQVADIFTKALSPLRFTTLRDILKVVDRFSVVHPL